MGWFDGLIEIGASLLKDVVIPSVVSAGVQVGAQSLFGGNQKDIRTGEQKQFEEQKLNSYKQLSADYNAGQRSLPMWNAAEEEDIRKRTLAEAARSGIQDSGQAMGMVNKNLATYRGNVSQQHEQNQIARGNSLMGGGFQPMQYNPYNVSVQSPVRVPKRPGDPSQPQPNDTVSRDANGGQAPPNERYGPYPNSSQV